MTMEVMTCVKCGCDVTTEDARIVRGDRYCDECYADTFTCGHCGTVEEEEGRLRRSYADELLCEDCATECASCSCIVNPDEARTDEGGKSLCESCASEFHECGGCGCFVSDNDVRYLHDEPYCERCIRAIAVSCDDCGEWVHRRDINRDQSGFSLCDDCADGPYYRCSECDLFVRTGRRCEDCAENNLIHEHSYKPSPIFFSTSSEDAASKFFMGVELEVDKGQSVTDLARHLLEWEPERFYLKNDSSLRNGVEIVTHPMTLDYHMNEFPWQELCRKVRNHGFLSHDTDTCGLHIHMSRDAFTEAETMKFLFIIERFWSQWVKFSRRTVSNLERWAARYGYGSSLQGLYNTALRSRDKYKAVNLVNRSTIEIRIFRGSLNHKTIKAALQLCAHLHHLSRTIETDTIMALEWEDIVNSITADSEELSQYLAARELGITPGDND